MKNHSGCVAFVLGVSVQAFAQTPPTPKTAFLFSWPVKPLETYFDASPFLKPDPWYHLGADYNAKDGVDLGDPVYVVANGVVVDVQLKPQKDSWGNVVVIKHILYPPAYPSELTAVIYSLYGHLKDVNVVKNSVVIRGQKIGTIGNAGGSYPPHLHFEMRVDANWNVGKPQGSQAPPLEPKVAVRWRDPALFISDHMEKQTILLTSGVAKSFVPARLTSVRLTYLSYQGRDLTVDQAISNGLVYSSVPYVDPNSYFRRSFRFSEIIWYQDFEYKVTALKTGVTLHLILPKNDHQKERAVKDVLIWCAGNAKFISCQPETIKDSAYQDRFAYYREMRCRFKKRNNTQVDVLIYHTTDKIYPLFRVMSYVDPDTNQRVASRELTPYDIE